MTEFLVILFSTTLLHAVVSALVWSVHRHLAGTPVIAFSFIVGAGSLAAGLAYRPGPTFLDGMTGLLPALFVNASVALCVNGVMIFLNRPPRRWLLPFCILATLIYWPLALAVNPADGALRSIAGNATVTVAIGSLVPVLWRVQGDCAWLRWSLLPAMLIHLAIQDSWSLYRVALSLSGIVDPKMFFPWTIIEASVFHHLWFVCFLAMLGSRLRSSLEQRNRELAHEVEQRRHLEQQLAATLAAERQIHAEHRQLLNIVAHEVRTPLSGIDRSAELLQDLSDDLPPDGRRRLSNIRDGVHRVSELVDRILASERAAHVEPRPQRIDARAALQTVLEGLSHLGADHRVRVELPPGPVEFTADPGMFIAVLRNLVENALKYSAPATDVGVSVSAADGAVTVRVLDSGIGIPEVERRSIGRRFYRASNTGQIGGNGLGLFISRRFLAEMGGDLRHEPGPGDRGTCATMTLPIGAHPGEEAPGTGMPVERERRYA